MKAFLAALILAVSLLAPVLAQDAPTGLSPDAIAAQT
jgi:hypothetical protein